MFKNEVYLLLGVLVLTALLAYGQPAEGSCKPVKEYPNRTYMV